jgi:hypothetical protein
LRVVELVLVCRADERAGRLDWSALSRLLDETDTLRFVHPSFALAERLSPGTIDPRLAARAASVASRRARAVVAAVTESYMAPLGHPSFEAKMMWSRGPLETLLNATELALPSDDGIGAGPLAMLARRIGAVASGRARWRSRSAPDTLPPP